MSIKSAIDNLRAELSLIGAPYVNLDIYIHDVVGYEDALKMACDIQLATGGSIEPRSAGRTTWIGIYPAGASIIYQRKKGER